MKRNLLILVIILLIGFIVNSCIDDEKKISCECNPKQHNEGEICCTGNGCNCTIILNCNCPADTLHLIGENCRGSLNCECELNVIGTRASNGIAITNRHGLDSVVFTEMVSVVNEALKGYVTALDTYLLSETQREYIKNNIKEIKVAPINSESTAAFINEGILTVFDGNTILEIVIPLKIWCEAKNIY